MDTIKQGLLEDAQGTQRELEPVQVARIKAATAGLADILAELLGTENKECTRVSGN